MSLRYINLTPKQQNIIFARRAGYTPTTKEDLILMSLVLIRGALMALTLKITRSLKS